MEKRNNGKKLQESLFWVSAHSETKKAEAERRIKEEQIHVDYEVREYPLEVVVQKYETDLEEGKNEIFIPAYQRPYVWGTQQESEFIESLLLGLPIPYLFTADNEGRSEIVDGSQRIRAIYYFFNDVFPLRGLNILKDLNGFYFSDLVESRQKRLKKRTIRIIELTDKADYGVRKEMFRRINVSPTILTDMEVRQGLYEGEFLEFVKGCTETRLFIKLCPTSSKKEKKGARAELVLRFFAFGERLNEFEQQVDTFIDAYIKDKMLDFDKKTMLNSFNAVLSFVDKYFPHYGFAKSAKAISTPRVRFEAIAVGVALALKENPDLVTTKEAVLEWLESEEFKAVTTTDAANNKANVMARINFVKNQLLGTI